MRIASWLGLISDGPGKKVRTTTITDELGVPVLVQGSSVHDPDAPIAANVKAGGALPNPSSDAALATTMRDLPPNAAKETGGTLSTIAARLGGALVAGLDYSSHQPTLPNVGANFATGGPYSNYVLAATLPAGTRAAWACENNSGMQIVVLLDDGTAAPGAAPVSATVFAIEGGTGGPGSPGGSLPYDPWHKGRVQIFAPSLPAQVALWMV